MVRALRAIGERHARLDEDGGLTLAAGGSELQVSHIIVSAMVSEGLLLRFSDHVRRSKEGRAYLRRALASASEEPFGEQHRVRTVRRIKDGDEELSASVNAAENPLSWLALRKGKNGKPLVDETQLAAGMRLFQDHERGHHRDRVTQSWDASGVRSSARRDRLSASEAACAARKRVEGALNAVGPGLAEILVAVCCEECGLEAAEKRFGWPLRSGKVVLRLALDRLASHYGIARRAKGVSAPLVHWGVEGYRPTA
ncbi:MAG: DUF6456 domain-containing protein [Pseudomonadota bacterium]